MTLFFCLLLVRDKQSVIQELQSLPSPSFGTPGHYPALPFESYSTAVRLVMRYRVCRGSIG